MAKSLLSILSGKHLWKIMLLAVLLGCNITRTLPTPTPAPPPAFTPLPPVDQQPLTTQEAINPNCPATPPGWIPYTVVPGDSMGLLAEQTDSTIEELVAGNCLDNPDQIYVGQQIFLPRQPVISP